VLSNTGSVLATQLPSRSHPLLQLVSAAMAYQLDQGAAQRLNGGETGLTPVMQCVGECWRTLTDYHSFGHV